MKTIWGLIGAGVWVLAACGSDSSPGTEAPEPDADAQGAEVTTDEGGDPDGDAGEVSGDADVPEPAERARAFVIEDEADLIAGPRAHGQIGDFRIDNGKVAFVIDGIRETGGYRQRGGHVVDMDLIGSERASGQDLFGEVIFAFGMDTLDPDTAEILSDGSDGGPARIRLSGPSTQNPFAAQAIGAVLANASYGLDVAYDYSLEPGATALRLDIHVENPEPTEIFVDWPIIFANLAFGVVPWVPGAGASSTSGRPLPYLGWVGYGASYGLVAEANDLWAFFNFEGISIAQMDSFVLGAGESRTLTYWYTATEEGSIGLDKLSREVHGTEPVGTLIGEVKLPETLQPEGAWLGVWRDGFAWAWVRVEADRDFRAELPVGTYEVEAFARRHAASERKEVEIAEGGIKELGLELLPAGTLTVRVQDSAGDPVHGRVELFRTGLTPSPFAPESMRIVEGWTGTSAGSAYAAFGEATILLPAGTYEAVASRGFAYTTATEALTVEAGQESEITLVIDQVVDTTGWVSSDFHIHAERSPDSSVPHDIRALQALTTNLDVPIITEHVNVAGLQHAAEHAGIGGLIAGPAGQEITSFAFGHFNAFPLVWDPTRLNFGGIIPYSIRPPEVFQQARDQHAGEVVIQINHPRTFNIGGYFSYVGLDASGPDLVVENQEDWSLNWDTVEVFTKDCDGGQPLQDWIGLRNHGIVRTLASGGDHHRVYQIPGSPRNWIKVPGGLGALLEDEQNLVQPVRDGHLFVSCGPFVRFEAADGTGIGGRTAPNAEGAVVFHAQVQAPPWMSVDEVRLLENGEVVDAVDVSLEGEVVRFDDMFVATPASDAWYVLEVVGSGNNEPIDPNTPYAITNPIEIDVDGDGAWTAPRLQRR